VINRPAPTVAPARDGRGLIEIIKWHNSKSSNRIAFTRDELASIAEQIAHILNPPDSTEERSS
jgi:hypothetical protein